MKAISDPSGNALHMKQSLNDSVRSKGERETNRKYGNLTKFPTKKASSSAGDPFDTLGLPEILYEAPRPKQIMLSTGPTNSFNFYFILFFYFVKVKVCNNISHFFTPRKKKEEHFSFYTEKCYKLYIYFSMLTRQRLGKGSSPFQNLFVFSI